MARTKPRAKKFQGHESLPVSDSYDPWNDQFPPLIGAPQHFSYDTEPAIDREAFLPLVEELSDELTDGSFTWQALAVTALHIAAEEFIVEVMQAADASALDANRDFVNAEDVQQAHSFFVSKQEADGGQDQESEGQEAETQRVGENVGQVGNGGEKN